MNLPRYTETLPNGTTFHLHLIPGGVFDMGSDDDDEEAYDEEKPLRRDVSVAPFYMAPHVVTQQVWAAVMDGANPSYFKGPTRPVVMVSWFDCAAFIERLNARTRDARAHAGVGAYRFPTEAEWEYAARGGRRYFKYAGSDKLKEVGWYNDNSDGVTHPVGEQLPNEYGLYDMSGNVYEWCADHWHGNYLDAPKDSRAWLTDEDSARRVVRGGSCFDVSQDCRCAYRRRYAPVNGYDRIGLRLALSPSQLAGL
jgi:formylglycine-generating enzyme